MSSNLFQEAQDALYKVAKDSADFIEVKLASNDTDFSPADKERLQLALSVLKIMWSSKDNHESNKYDDISVCPEYKSNEYGDISIHTDEESEVENIPF